MEPNATSSSEKAPVSKLDLFLQEDSYQALVEAFKDEENMRYVIARIPNDSLEDALHVIDSPEVATKASPEQIDALRTRLLALKEEMSGVNGGSVLNVRGAAAYEALPQEDKDYLARQQIGKNHIGLPAMALETLVLEGKQATVDLLKRYRIEDTETAPATPVDGIVGEMRGKLSQYT